MESDQIESKVDCDSVSRGLEQVIYDYGGSRIYIEKDGHRELLADTYHTEEFAVAVRNFIDDWLNR